MRPGQTLVFCKGDRVLAIPATQWDGPVPSRGELVRVGTDYIGDKFFPVDSQFNPIPNPKPPIPTITLPYGYGQSAHQHPAIVR